MKKPAIFALIALTAAAAGAAAGSAPLAGCSPFGDVSPALCPFVLELYYLGISAGTSLTTFSPDQPITRGQAAVFVAKGVDAAITRSSRRAALGQWWTTTAGHYDIGLGATPVGNSPVWVVSDGADLWVANQGDGTVSRVRGSDGRLLETWTCIDHPVQTLVALGRVFVLSGGATGGLYAIDPSLPPGAAVLVASTGAYGVSMTFDGSRFWVSKAGDAGPGEIRILTPGPIPWPMTTVPAGSSHSFVGQLMFDGSSVWLVCANNEMLRLDSAGAVTQAVGLQYENGYPTFDGTNFWIPSGSLGHQPTMYMYVVNASRGTIVAAMTGNGVDGGSLMAAFDGRRVLVTNAGGGVSLWDAASLTPLGSFLSSPGTQPFTACSDGTNFWITLRSTNQLARF